MGFVILLTLRITTKILTTRATRARAKAWCLIIYAEASLSHSGQGESLVPPSTRGSVSLSLSHGGRAKAWCFLKTRKRVSLTGGRATAWRLLIHAESSLSMTNPRLMISRFRPWASEKAAEDENIRQMQQVKLELEQAGPRDPAPIADKVPAALRGRLFAHASDFRVQILRRIERNMTGVATRPYDREIDAMDARYASQEAAGHHIPHATSSTAFKTADS